MNHTELINRIEKLYLNMIYLESKGMETKNYDVMICKYAKVLSDQKRRFKELVKKNPNSLPARYLKGRIYKINTVLSMVKDITGDLK